MAGRLIALVGPSGVGKDSVMAALAKAHPRLGLVKRVITRPEGLGGEDYESVSTTEFESRKARGAFALDWSAHGLLYGILKTVHDDLAKGHDLLVNLSRGVLPAAEATFPDLVTLRLTASNTTLRARLSGRGRETADDIEQRLKRADFPMPAGVIYTDLSNDGALDETIAVALAVLYPEDVLT